MLIKNIELKNFRNYKNLKLKVSDTTHIISGMNAQGKSNFIESIYYCAFSRSFRKSKDRELIKHGSDNFFIKIEFESEGREESIIIYLDKNLKKRIKINDVAIRKISEFIGKLKIACFTPEDLYLISGSPSERRRFLNRELSQIYPAYFRNIIDYNLALNQRNSAIKQYKINPSDVNTISMWDYKICELSKKIIEKRVFYLEKINQISSKLHKQMSGDKEKLKIEYRGIFNSKNNENYGRIDFELKKLLEENLENDIRYGHTTVGIHKDDFDIFIDDKEVKKFASQGQKKLAALSIKLSQIEMIKDITGITPIVLLDDVSSELDAERRIFLLNYINNFQSFMTTTDIDIFKNKKHQFKHITVSDGILKEEFPCKKH